jgi:hypothetical protein
MLDTIDEEMVAAVGHLRRHRPDLAHAALFDATARFPADPRLIHMMAGIDLGLGRLAPALDGFLSALRRGGDMDLRRDCARRIGAMIMRPEASGETARITAEGLLLCFSIGVGDPQPLGIAAIQRLKNTELREILRIGRSHGWEVAARRLLSSKYSRVLDSRLLRAALCQTINMDGEIELLLSETRQKILFRRNLEARVLRFLPVLAAQC